MKSKKIKNLESKINSARNAYYNTETPLVSDQVFDAWVDELKQLDPQNKAVTMVGAPLAPSEWKKAKHLIQMGSLDKVNTPSELNDWAKNKNCDSWFVAEKLDGISVEVIYEGGKFTQAITRGSEGIIGEDITVNVAKMVGVPGTLSSGFTGSLRGEIIMLKSIWKSNFTDKANPRNAAAGVSKRLDGVGVNKLNVMFYQALGDVDFDTELSQFEWLEKNNFTTPNHWTFANVNDISSHWRAYQDSSREKLDYDIDGLVIRLNDLVKQTSLGDKDLRPLGAIAFKFDNEMRESTIRDIIWQTGSIGRVSPVAVVDPVTLVGAVITRASLYNIAYINELQLDVGATVLVARANDVIPRIEQLVKGTGTIAKSPTNCPECHALIKIDGEYLICTNVDSCPAQVVGKMDNWIQAQGILEFGSALLKRLVESNKATTIADLYALTTEDLASLDRMGDKSAQNCYNTLHANMEIPLDVFIGGLSIPLIGSSTIRAIMSVGFDTLEKIQALTIDQLQNIPSVGPSRAKSLFNGLKSNHDLINNIIKNGVSIKMKTQGKLTGKSVVFTGTMLNKRADLEKMAIDAGGEVKSSCSKNTTYLVIADPNSQTTKAVAARKLGVKLISEETFIKLALPDDKHLLY